MDVYSEWVDACDAVAKENTELGQELGSSRRITDDDHGDIGHDLRGDDLDGDDYEGEGIVADDEY